ncbi:hypothetical protein GCM10011509_01830 [Ornithinimicrobium pekingense]|uniref:ABC transporter permease n=2 Tax=Ornithinimicrobium pekingense TaxID=384677 RepID=A0ABQ2F678_9MICO|nr:hypothetical protein GCM10011509_01830 [Ornithinimicrobium pekingense]
MTTTARPGTETAYPPQIDAVGALPFSRLLRTELRKLIDTRAGRWLVVAILVITALSMGVTLWLNRETGTGMLGLMLAANIPQALLIPILGVMTAANEWGQRTALITFTQEPRRLRVMAAKTLAAVLLGLGVLLVTTLLAAAAHTVSVSAAGGGEVDAWLGWPLTVNLLVLQTIGVLMGVAFGALFLNVPVGIVAYFLVPMLSPLLFLTTAWLRENSAWLDMSVAQGALLGDEWATGEQWAQVGTTSALWILLPLAVGFWRVARREVK